MFRAVKIYYFNQVIFEDIVKLKENGIHYIGKKRLEWIILQ